MNINAETELLSELVKIQQQIELCFDQKQWQKVEKIDKHCCIVLERINEFAKSGSSILLKLQVDLLIKSYRELLTKSIFEQEKLDKRHELLSIQNVEALNQKNSLELQPNLQ
ncbi:MAG: hypothetical protein HRU38_17560 [Saccharospirillaceae bacterium]|nr:hypothetical protein [Pseudomonadales bacterium]NRB80447.1 hypothetical protein [Saccharospirillaceae bacterium]